MKKTMHAVVVRAPMQFEVEKVPVPESFVGDCCYELKPAVSRL